MIRVLSLGAGVQSTTVLRMSIAGELDPIDFCVFSDTGWEPDAVYAHMVKLRSEARDAGIPVYVVSKSTGGIFEDIKAAQLDGVKWPATLPLFVLQGEGDRGISRRQCTREYKITPVEQMIRMVMGYGPRERIPPASCEHWFGISLDESRRARLSGVKWKTFHYPLIEAEMTRGDCLRWHDDRGLERPPRSACIGCPYRSDAEWIDMRDNRPQEWAQAVEFDEVIRNKAGMRGEQFLHYTRVPLAEAELRPGARLKTEQVHMRFGDFGDECAGMCGV